MSNLAAIYRALGLHEDALSMDESALEIRRRVLPPRHPDIATSLYNTSLCYEEAGNMPRAVECAREALCIWQAALPPSHPRVVAAAKKVCDLES
jgi:tetratricopeptide (TPR) repeat protein